MAHWHRIGHLMTLNKLPKEIVSSQSVDKFKNTVLQE